jgi:hypothetical protein
MEPTTTTTEVAPFTVDTFAEFWADPTSAGPPDELADDIVGYWPGREEPIRGKADYVGTLGKLFTLVPDLTLAVAEHAENGEYLFIRWIATGTGASGAFEQTGVDRIKIADGKVAENVIVFDRAAMEEKVGAKLPI